MSSSSRLMRLAFVATAPLLALLLMLLFGDRAFAQTPSNPPAAVDSTQDSCKSATVSCVITAGLSLVNAWALPLLGALAGIGVVTMALIQAAKDLIPLRRGFHRTAVTAWLTDRGAVDQLPNIVALATGGDEKALFELPATGLMGQLTTVSRIVLLFPSAYEPLLRTFAGSRPEVKADISLLIDTDLAPHEPADPGVSPADLERARVRVGNMIERNIDALQISLSSRWEWLNKSASFVVSGLVTFATFVVFYYTKDFTTGWEGKGQLAVAMIPVTVLAGFVAPVAKDLVTALQSLRKV
jgi:hypothetical protein